MEREEPILSSNGETVRTGLPNMRHYEDGRRVHRFAPISEELQSSGYPAAVVNEKNIARFVGRIQIFMEKNLGRYAEPEASRGLTRLPASIFKDVNPGGKLSKLLKCTLGVCQEKGWEELPSFEKGTLREDYMELLTHLDSVLRKEKVLPLIRVYLSPSIRPEEAVELRNCVWSHSALLVKVPEVATHIVYPDVQRSEESSDGEKLLCRILAIEPRAGNNLAHVHWWYCPPSYDTRIVAKDVCGDIDPYGPAPPVWHVQASFLRDTHKFNEWMVEEDYELPDTFPDIIELPDYLTDSKSTTDSCGVRGGKVRKLTLKVTVMTVRKRKSSYGRRQQRDGQGNIIVSLPDIPLSPASDSEQECDTSAHSSSQSPIAGQREPSQADEARLAEISGGRMGGRAMDSEDDPDGISGNEEQGNSQCKESQPRAPKVHTSNGSHEAPGHGSWFSLEKIHIIESRSLPEYFCGRYASKTPETYKQIRNFMIETWRKRPSQYLTATAVRRHLFGDAPSLVRIHAFLEHWGLINHNVDAKTRPLSPFLPPPYVTPARECIFFLDSGSAADVRDYSYSATTKQSPIFRERPKQSLETDRNGLDPAGGQEKESECDERRGASLAPQDSNDRSSVDFSDQNTQSHADSYLFSTTRLRRNRVRHNYNEDVLDSEEEGGRNSVDVPSSSFQEEFGRGDVGINPLSYNIELLRRRLKRLASGADTIEAGPEQNRKLRRKKNRAIEYHCDICRQDCSALRYHSSKHADMDLCGTCYTNQDYTSDMDPSDFVPMYSPPSVLFKRRKRSGMKKLEPPKGKRRRTGNSRAQSRAQSDAEEESELEESSSGEDDFEDSVWTESETLLLLEGLEMYSDHWDMVAEHVGSKTVAQCIAQFVKLPIEDPYLSRGGQNWWDADALGEGIHLPGQPGTVEICQSGLQLSEEQMNRIEEVLDDRLGRGRSLTGVAAVMTDRNNAIGLDVAVLAILAGKELKSKTADFDFESCSRSRTWKSSSDSLEYKAMPDTTMSIRRILEEDWCLRLAQSFLAQNGDASKNSTHSGATKLRIPGLGTSEIMLSGNLRNEEGRVMDTCAGTRTGENSPASVGTRDKTRQPCYERTGIDPESTRAIASVILTAAQRRANDIAQIEQDELNRLHSVANETLLGIVRLQVARLRSILEYERRAAAVRQRQKHRIFADLLVAKTMHAISPHLVAEKGTMGVRKIGEAAEKEDGRAKPLDVSSNVQLVDRSKSVSVVTLAPPSKVRMDHLVRNAPGIHAVDNLERSQKWDYLYRGQGMSFDPAATPGQLIDERYWPVPERNDDGIGTIDFSAAGRDFGLRKIQGPLFQEMRGQTMQNQRTFPNGQWSFSGRPLNGAVQTFGLSSDQPDRSPSLQRLNFERTRQMQRAAGSTQFFEDNRDTENARLSIQHGSTMQFYDGQGSW